MNPSCTYLCQVHQLLVDLLVELVLLLQQLVGHELVDRDEHQMSHSMAHAQARERSAGVGSAGVGRGERAAHLRRRDGHVTLAHFVREADRCGGDSPE